MGTCDIRLSKKMYRYLDYIYYNPVQSGNVSDSKNVKYFFSNYVLKSRYNINYKNKGDEF